VFLRGQQPWTLEFVQELQHKGGVDAFLEVRMEKGTAVLQEALEFFRLTEG